MTARDDRLHSGRRLPQHLHALCPSGPATRQTFHAHTGHGSAWPSPAAARSAACTNSAHCARSTKPSTASTSHDLDSYVGVSSGAFLAAGLANRMSTAEMCRIFITGDSDDARFRPDTFLRPALFEYLQRAASLPRLTLDWWRDLAARSARHALVRPDQPLRRAGADRPVRQRARSSASCATSSPGAGAATISANSSQAVRGRGRTRQRRGRAVRQRRLGRRADLARRCRPAPPCPACIRRSRCAAATSSMAHCAAPCMPRCCWNATSTC